MANNSIATAAYFPTASHLLTTWRETLQEDVTAAPAVLAGAEVEAGVVTTNLDAVTKAFSAYVLLLMAINICLNGLVIFSVLYLQRNRLKSSQLVLLQLSVSDLLIALLYLPFLLVLLLRDSDVEDCRMLCAALAALERGLIAASIWGIAFVSLDRYLYIVKHSSYKSAMTMRRSLGGAAVVWIIALVFGTTSFLVSAHFRDGSGACVCHLTLDFYGFYHLMYSAGYITLCFILPTTLMLVFYGFVMRVAQQRAAGRSKNPFRKAPDRENIRYSPTGRSKSSYPLHPSAGNSNRAWNSSQGEGIHLHKVKAARILFIVITLYIACITPYFVINIALATGHWNPRGFPYIVYLGSILLLHSNNSCNPLFYGFANRRLRMTLTDYLRRKLGRSGVVATAEYHVKRGRTNSRISIMGESSDCSMGGNLTRRVSQSSDISALSCMSREAFVSRDLLDIYSGGPQGQPAQGASSRVCGNLSSEGWSQDDPVQRNTDPSTLTTPVAITDTPTSTLLGRGHDTSASAPSRVDVHCWSAAESNAITSWDEASGDEAEERMIVLTSVGCKNLATPSCTPSSANSSSGLTAFEDHHSHTHPPGASVPIRRPLESKRSAALSQIAEAAMLFSVQEDNSPKDWTSTLATMSPSPDAMLQPNHLPRAEPTYAWTTAE